MLRIRLRRTGKKKKPSYRIVVADSRSPRDGAFVEIVGQYDPLTEPATINLDSEKVQEWLRRGAQPSETVAKLIKRAGSTPAAVAAPVAAVAAAPAPSATAEPAAETTEPTETATEA